MIAKEIAALVSMPRLLRELGFPVNERSRRSECVLHGGKNPTAFSWTEDGEWFCFTRCGGGDRISLVMAARRCDFKAAISFLAALAGVSTYETPESRAEIARARRERKRREIERANATAAERVEMLRARAEVLSLERLRRNASNRLTELTGWNFERFAGEAEMAWQALALVSSQMPRAAAAYTTIAFGHPDLKAAFVQHPEQRSAMIDAALQEGGTRNEKNHFIGFVV
jgi:hypothetical protein